MLGQHLGRPLEISTGDLLRRRGRNRGDQGGEGRDREGCSYDSHDMDSPVHGFLLFPAGINARTGGCFPPGPTKEQAARRIAQPCRVCGPGSAKPVEVSFAADPLGAAPGPAGIANVSGRGLTCPSRPEDPTHDSKRVRPRHLGRHRIHRAPRGRAHGPQDRSRGTPDPLGHRRPEQGKARGAARRPGPILAADRHRRCGRPGRHAVPGRTNVRGLLDRRTLCALWIRTRGRLRGRRHPLL